MEIFLLLLKFQYDVSFGLEFSLAIKCNLKIKYQLPLYLPFIYNYIKMGKEIKKKVDIQCRLIEIRQGGRKISGRID